MQSKNDELMARLQSVQSQVSAEGNYPLAPYLSKEQFQDLITHLLTQTDTCVPARFPKDTKLTRTSHITIDQNGDYVAILDTKTKTIRGKSNKSIVATGAKKSVKTSWRIDVWPPVEFVSSTSHGFSDVALAVKEARIAREMNTPFHPDLMTSITYPSAKLSVAVALFSKKMRSLSSNIKSLDLVSRYIISYGLIYALRYMHKQGLAYGDVSATNILIDTITDTNLFYPIVIDFGATNAPNQPACVTPGYESPELFCHFIHRPVFQDFYTKDDSPDTLAQGYARKRSQLATHGRDPRAMSLKQIYPTHYQDGLSTLENDVWSLGIVLYRIFNNGNFPSFEEFTKNQQPEFIAQMLTQEKGMRPDCELVMRYFVLSLARNKTITHTMRQEILLALFRLSNDPLFHAHLINDFIAISKSNIQNLCHTGLDTSKVLRISILNGHTEFLKHLFTTKFDLKSFITSVLEESDLIIKSNLMTEIINYFQGITYTLDIAFEQNADKGKEIILYLKQIKCPMEDTFIFYIRNDFLDGSHSKRYFERLKILFELYPDLDIKNILEKSKDLSNTHFKYTVGVFQELDVPCLPLLRALLFDTNTSRTLFHKIISSGINLKPAFELALEHATRPTLYPHHYNALKAMLIAGYGKTDKDFVVTSVSKALRLVVLDSRNITDAIYRLKRFGGPYEESWGWENATGKLFTCFQFTLHALQGYEELVHYRLFSFLTRNDSNASRLGQVMKIARFCLGANGLVELLDKLRDASSQYESTHNEKKGYIARFFKTQSSLVRQLDTAASIVTKINDDTISLASLGTTTPVSDSETAIASLYMNC